MVTSSKKEVLGEETFNLARESFEAFSKGSPSITDKDAKWALLLSLGIDQQFEGELTFERLLEVLAKAVDEADPVEGLCVDIADCCDPDLTGCCSLESLIDYLKKANWLGSSEEAMMPAMEALIEDPAKVCYREVMLAIIT